MSHLINLNSTFNHLFDDLFNTNISNFVGSDFVSNIPSINVLETGDDFKIELAAPGLEKEDFDINVEKDQLTISVKKETSNEVKEEKHMRKEFSYNSFTRSFHLPEDVQSDAINANYENGILKIILPKKDTAKELPKRTIEVS